MTTSSIDRMIEYCTSIGKEFEARLNRIRAFVPNHNLSSGTANEAILRNFLANLTAHRFKVSQGFICNPANSEAVSKQCDILVHDYHSYPRVYVDGDIEIVFPQAVRMLIEVKTKLHNQQELDNALNNICAGRRLDFRINGVVFAFESNGLDTMISHIQGYPEKLNLNYAPIAILLLEQGSIIHRWPGSEVGGNRTTFEVRRSKDGRGDVVIAFLLLLFFEAQMLGAVGGAEIENMLRDILVHKTDLVRDDLTIGGM